MVSKNLHMQNYRHKLQLHLTHPQVFLDRGRFQVTPSRARMIHYSFVEQGPRFCAKNSQGPLLRLLRKKKELHNCWDRQEERQDKTSFVSEPQAIYPSAIDRSIKFCNK
jgi:hypothetical protein